MLLENGVCGQICWGDLIYIYMCKYIYIHLYISMILYSQRWSQKKSWKQRFSPLRGKSCPKWCVAFQILYLTYLVWLSVCFAAEVYDYRACSTLLGMLWNKQHIHYIIKIWKIPNSEYIWPQGFWILDCELCQSPLLDVYPIHSISRLWEAL